MDKISQIIGQVTMALTRGLLGPGETAELRRIDPERPSCPAFWRVMTVWIAPEKRLSPEQENRWAMILSGMARMKPLLSLPGRTLGKALAEAGFTERRLARLLRTTDAKNLADQVRRITGFLVSQGVPINWIDFAYFILTTDPEKREEKNRSVAADYYYAIKQKETVT